MHSSAITHESLYFRSLAEMGRAPYFGGAGVGIVKALHRAFGPWPVAVGSSGAASPAMAWLRENTGTELFHYPPPASHGRPAPCPVPQGSWDKGVVPTVLGANERDAMNVHSIAFGLGVRVETSRFRPLDSILEPKVGLGLLYCGHLDGAAQVLQGARRLLRVARPAVLLVRNPALESGDSEGDLNAAFQELAEAGYRLLDSTLACCETPRQIHEALHYCRETVFIGLSAELYTADLPGRLVGDPDDPVFADDFETARRVAYWQYLTSYSDESVPRIVEARVENGMDCTGFYDLENWESIYWRWSGPQPCASVRIPMYRPGRYHLRCAFTNVAQEQVLSTLRIFAGGQLLAHTVRRSEHGIQLEGIFSQSLRMFAPVLEIRFLHSETYQASSEDPRRLGFALQSITLELTE